MSRNNNIPLDDLDGELWRPIKDYSGLYMISNMGRVKSVGRTHQMPNTGTKDYPDLIMAHGRTSHGYDYVNLRDNGESKSRTVHRLVALHWVDNPTGFKVVHHKSGIKSDNRAINLEWTTSSINNKRAYEQGLKKGTWTGKKGKDNPSSKRVLQLSRNHEVCFAQYDSKTIAAAKTGISASCISAVIHGRQNHAGKFKWEFVA